MLGDGAKSEECKIVYGSGISEYPQSTTGNISDIFDMSGGAWDQVIGNYNNIIGKSNFTQLPNSKYYETFTTSTTSTACGDSLCYGHALSETPGWYHDWTYFVSNDNPWLVRGGRWLSKRCCRII